MEDQDKKPLIVTKDLCRGYIMGREQVVALRNVNLTIHEGEIVCIFGSSGSGKSTLLNQLAGLEKPNRGEVWIDGTDIAKLNENEMTAFRQKNIGFVFQSYNLLPALTAEENVALPLSFFGIDRKTRIQAARAVLSAVGLGDRTQHYPTQMSGGQQQRTGIARAFITRPRILFADEPTGNLDSKTTTEIMDMMVRFVRTYKETMVMVSHDPEMAAYADRIITMRDGQILRDEYINKECVSK